MKPDEISSENDSSKLLKNHNQNVRYDTLTDDLRYPQSNNGQFYSGARTTTTDIIQSPLWFSKRLLVSVIFFISFVNFQLLRNNINIAIVEMTTNKTYTKEGVTITQPPEFNWDTSTIGLVMSMLSYGGLFSFLGGLLSDRFGGSRTCAMSMMAAGILTILHPVTLYLNFYAFLVLRFFTGLFEIFFYVSTADVYSRWFPKKERSMLISFSFNGTNAGIALVYPFCGYISYRWDWQMVFYVTGTISILVSSICYISVQNTPSQDKWISQKELNYLLTEADRDTAQKKVDHPYKMIFQSIPVWNLCTVHFVHTWLVTLIGSSLPLYIKDMTNKETDEIGVLSSIPNTIYLIMFPVAGTLMDYWRNRGGMTITEIHKTTIAIAYLSTSLFFTAAAFLRDFTLSMVLLVFVQISTSPVPLIVELLNVNLAPDHCSVISALTSFSYSVSAIVAQTVTGFMIASHSLKEWNNCFLLAAAITTLDAALFIMYGSSEPQSWSLAE